ncbi:phage/plasmid primase, P4 family [Haloimpatiens sp. FM7330]|uniref:phage/plasmid primase, P4 family n=1 Tax=Haloimpatiens sp. FM7330 TaxID=3298610 RepID=UPI00362ABF0F
MIKIRNYEKLVDEIKNYLRKYLELKGIEIKGKSFKCFQHNDSNPSAGLTKDERGFRCHACGISGDIFTAYSIIENKSIRGQEFFNVLKELADIFNISYELDDDYRLVKDNAYIYVDNMGNEAYKIVRYHEEDAYGNIILKSNRKISKVFKAYTRTNDGWKLGMEEQSRYIYNLKEISKAIKDEEDVYFVEGEKCAELIKDKFGFTSTTIAFGSNSWKEPYIELYKKQLKGANVILIPDNDDNGYKLMNQVAKDLGKVVKSLKIIKLDEDLTLPTGGDLEEWIQLGGKKERLLKLKEKSKELIEDECTWYEKDELGRIKVNTGLLSRYLINKNPSIYSAARFYLYNKGVYKECKYNEVQAIIKDKIEDRLCKMSLIRDVEGLWAIDKKVIKAPNELDTESNIINVKNGLYNILTGELKGHEHNFISTIQLDVKYNSDAKGSVFNKFLNDVVSDKEFQLLLQEIAGYTMSTFNKAKKFFIIQGPRDCGKTTFLNLIMSIIGQEYLSHINLQHLNERFNKAELFGKIANIATELPDKGIEDVGFIKALVGQDPIQAEKKCKDPFAFVNKAKLIFACNNLPQNYGDKSDAFYNKMIIVRFERKFNDQDIDVMLPEKLEKEKEYVFLWAMEGLRRLVNNGFKFTETNTTKELVVSYKLKSNNALAFVKDCCELNQNAQIGSTILYNNYKNYCTKNNYKAVSRNKFKEELENAYKDKIHSKLITSKRISGYIGITLNKFTY